MRRVAMVLATVSLIAVGMTATPARAHVGWWGYPAWQENGWREHEWRQREWRHHWWREHHRYWNPGYYRYGSYDPPAYYGFDFGSWAPANGKRRTG